MNNIIHTIRHTARAAAVLLLALCTAQTAWAWSGQGTEAKPYQITNASDLKQLATDVNSGTTYEGMYFKQTAAIDMAGETMSPIGDGSANHRFGGHYDGDNKAISHLAITGTTEYTALFGYVSGTNNDHGSKQPTSLKNIVLTDCNIDGSSASGGYAAGICANATLYTTVENCRVSGTIKGDYGAGGIVGYENQGNVKNCFADVTVTASVRSQYSSQAGKYVSYCIVGKIIGYVGSLGSSTVTGNYYRNDGATDATGAAITAIGKGSSTTYADDDRATPVYPDSGTSGLTISGGTPVVSLNDTNYSTKGDTYTIYDAAGWNIFCDFLNDNDTHNRFSGKTVRLGADITVSRMAGSSGHDFCGTFDGQEHTLTFNYGTAGSYASDEYAAPFHYVSNVGSTAAAFRDLHVAGDIYTSAKYAAGLIAQHWGTVNVENCRVSTVIHSSVSGDGTHGGIEAVNIGVLNITGCVFDGKLLTTTTNGSFNCGGFVGWHNGGTTNISNSLYAPAAIAGSETEVGPGTAGQNPSATFGRNAVNSIANSYYTRTLGTAQGKQARSITASGNATLAHAGVATEYSVSGITAYKSGGNFTSGILYNNVLYAGSGDAVSLTLSGDAPAGYQYSYTASAGTLSGSANPYTLTMPDADVTVTATLTVIPWDGDGSKGKPYIIKYASQLDLLAHRVNGTHGETRQSDGYYNTYFQLDNDISYPHTSAWNVTSTESNYEAIGGYYNNGSRSFRGHFDGNNKTISGIRIYRGGSGNADRFQGIFGLTDDGADIHDLTLADARITGYGNTGGIVGYNEGGTVARCHVAADVAVCAVQSGASYHGGIVGYNDGGTIEQCTSAATLTTADAAKSYNYGGIAGYNTGTLRDNLAIGATVPAAADKCYGAIVGYNSGTLQRNYYAACKVANTPNATNVGCNNADVTDNDGAMPGYFLTLGDGITSSAWSITIPKHKELNSSGQLVTVAAVTYNVAAEGTTVWFKSGETEGYSASYSVNGSPVSGNSITMPAAAVTVTSNGGAPIDLWDIAGGANGNSDHPYTITTTAGWNLLAGNVAAGKSYSDQYFQLGADNISISTMVGTSACHFSGHFNGNGNTLAVNITSAGEYTAPFRYVGGATITGLHTTGTVTTAHKCATGLVGRHNGDVTISNCRSSVAIVSSVSGDGTHGGFVATGSGTATIEGCLFDGVICTTASGLTNSCGGFVGWNGGTVNISNSLYAPAAVPEGKYAIGTAGCATFARNGVNSITNSYYTQVLGDAQGKARHTVTAGTGVTIDAIALTGDATAYTVSGITAYSGGGLQRDENLYYGSGDQLSLTLSNTATGDVPDGYQYDGYTASAGTLSGSTITMPDEDVTVSLALTVLPWSGDGTESSPYIIYNKDQLDLLAHRVNGTHGETCQEDGFYNTYFKLNNDITYDYTGLGDSDSNYEAIGGYYGGNRYFRGHFDGNNKTISGIRIYRGGSSSADKYQGIFGRTYFGADIHDLTLADARITGYYYTGGIVGYNNGGTVTRCHVADDVAVCAVQSDASWHGGIVGYNWGTIEQCTSAATLTLTNASKSRFYGGIAGYNENGTLRDNLAIGATVPAAKDNYYGAITSYNFGTLQRNYYAACKVADVENATGVGCYNADVTDNDGAMPGYLLTLGEGVTSSALSITIPAHKELNSSGQLVTVAARTYNVAAEGTTVWFKSDKAEGYSASYSVNGSPVSGNSITMPAANVTVTSNGGNPIDMWGIADGANGNSDHPYTITKTEGWNLLVGNVAAGKSYSGKHFQLGADNISISTMVGTNGHPFSGHFNGNGNTLAVNITSAGEYTAPFRYVGGATITGVHTTGTVTTAHKCATGLVGRHDGNLTISNCRSSVAIVSSVSGDGTHGGFVATGSGTATIEGCLFDGVICTTASDPTNKCGGFVGWNGGTVNISNSLYAPASVPEDKHAIGTDGCATFARNGAGIANSYYTESLGNAQGKACHSVTAGDGVTIDAIALTGDATAYTVSGITAYSGGGLQRDENLYYGSDDEVSLTLANNAGDTPEGYQDNGYTASAGTISGTGNPYTLTMPDADVTVAFSRQAIPWDGDGSEGKPYLIKYASQLDLLAHRVNGTHGEARQADGYKDTYFKLYNDISYTHTSDWNAFDSDESNYEAIGGYYNGGQRYFRGHFDGNNKTISGIRIYKGGDLFQGIFGGTAGADIHDLTLADARITGDDNTGGIVGYNEGGTVSDCHVAADVAVCAVNSNAWHHGGIAGQNNGGTIEQCTSAVTLTTANNSQDYGGIAGQNYGGTLRDNLAIGATVPAAKGSCYGAITGYNYISGTLQRNYYAACNVADVENATGVGCGYISDGNGGRIVADVTTNDGAVCINTLALAARQAPDGNFWTTYYNSALGFTIDADENACAYTATYGDGKLTLKKLGKEIPKNTAVIIVADNDVVSMATTTDLDDFNDPNDLHGVDYDTDVDDITSTLGTGTFYVLGMTTVGDEQHFGFHRYTGEEMAAHKAFVLVSGSQSARSLTMVFDEATGIESLTPDAAPKAQAAQHWFTLDGRRLQAKPTAPGIYVNNGKKVVIK